MRVLVATARPDHGMAVLDGKLYASVGFDGDSLSSVERHSRMDPAENVVAPSAHRSRHRGGVRSMALGRDFLLESSCAFVVYAKNTKKTERKRTTQGGMGKKHNAPEPPL